MARRGDLTFVNEKIGGLIAVERVPGKGRAVWRWLCSCGEYKNISAKSVRNGNTKSCGHLTRKNIIIGKSYARLTPTERLSDGLWLCVCSCPNKTVLAVKAFDLDTHGLKSCGCLRTTHKYDVFGEQLDAKEAAALFDVPYHWMRRALTTWSTEQAIAAACRRRLSQRIT